MSLLRQRLPADIRDAVFLTGMEEARPADYAGLKRRLRASRSTDS